MPCESCMFRNTFSISHPIHWQYMYFPIHFTNFISDDTQHLMWCQDLRVSDLNMLLTLICIAPFKILTSNYICGMCDTPKSFWFLSVWNPNTIFLCRIWEVRCQSINTIGGYRRRWIKYCSEFTNCLIPVEILIDNCFLNFLFLPHQIPAAFMPHQTKTINTLLAGALKLCYLWTSSHGHRKGLIATRKIKK